ncbi:MAG: FMN-binding protein [Firmicutes bacterium]|nr:FMN-binding protein [Bacillota bacterium]
MKNLKTISILSTALVLMLSMSALAWNDGVYTGQAAGHNGPIVVEVTVQEGLISNIAIIEHSETPYLSDAGFEVTKDIIAQQSLAVDAISGATVTSKAVIAAVENALAISDGIHTGEGQGYKGPIAVEVEVKDGQIISINILSHNETPYLSDAAFEGVPASIIASQSTTVDVVAGATATSKGIMAAVKDALGK